MGRFPDALLRTGGRFRNWRLTVSAVSDGAFAAARARNGSAGVLEIIAKRKCVLVSAAPRFSHLRRCESHPNRVARHVARRRIGRG